MLMECVIEDEQCTILVQEVKCEVVFEHTKNALNDVPCLCMLKVEQFLFFLWTNE